MILDINKNKVDEQHSSEENRQQEHGLNEAMLNPERGDAFITGLLSQTAENVERAPRVRRRRNTRNAHNRRRRRRMLKCIRALSQLSCAATRVQNLIANGSFLFED